MLSFAPSGQLYLPDGEHVLVADAFTGQMALLDVAEQSVVQIPADNIFRIYGMALSADPGGLYIGHQALMRLPASKRAPGDVGDEAQLRRMLQTREDFVAWHLASLALNFVTLALVTWAMILVAQLPDEVGKQPSRHEEAPNGVKPSPASN